MAAPAQLVQITFAGGIDQSTRSEALDPALAFVNKENIRQPSRGEADKRHGFDALTELTRVDATVRSAGYRMFSHGAMTCVIDRDVLDTHGDPNEAPAPVTRGRVPECGLSMMKVPTPGVPGGLSCTDSVRVGNYLALAYTAGTSVYASIVEAETGQIVVAPTLVYTGTAAEIYGLLGARGSTAMLFICCSGEANIQYSECDCSDATAASAGWSVASSAATTNSGLVMAVHSIGSRVYLANVNGSGGANQLTVTMFDGGAGASVAINTSSVTPTDAALGGASGDTLWVAWNETTAVKVIGLLTTNITTAPATVATVITAANAPSFDGIAVVASSTAGAGRLFVNDGGAERLYTRNFTTSGGAVTPGAAAATHYNVQMAGRPFRVGSRYYGVCRGYDTTENVAILCDLTEANAWVRPVANVAPRLAGGNFMAQAAQHTTREFWAPIMIQTAGNVTSLQMAKFDFDADARWRAVPYNGVTFLSGGLVSYFDGVRIAESNFVIRPPAPVLATNGAGTFTVAVGISVVLVYEQVDAAGNWHISAVSPATNSGAFTNKVNLAVTYRPLAISGRISTTTDPSVRTSVFATTDGGTAYYYVTSLANALTAATATYNITATPAGSTALLMGTGAYPNTGAQLDHRSPQGLAHLVAYNGFLVGALGEEVFWSGQDVDGEGTWWNDNFSAAISGGGEITALAEHEGTLFVFKRDRVFAMAGEPPSDNGAVGGLGAPQRLATTVGAVSPFTCTTELGVFYVSQRGIEILTRGGSQYIGEQIEQTFAAYPYVSAMTYDPESSCVLIEASAGRSAGLPSGNGRTFVFDMTTRSWQSFDRRSVSATADVPAADGCIVWDGDAWRYGWLRSNGVAYSEADHYLDPGDIWITKKAKTAYVKLSGIQGQQVMNRVLLLGKKHEPTGLGVAAGYDYDPSFETAATWTSTVLDALSTSLGRIQVGHDLHVDAEGQAVAVEVTDSAPVEGASSTEGRGATWIALTFEGQPRPNAAQLPEEAR